MFGSTILDVAIGMIFIYSVFSMIATKLNDLIAGWMKWRSKTLEEGIRTLLADPELANKVWNHQLVRGMTGKANKPPTYVPPNTLALALFDAITPKDGSPKALDQVRASVVNLPDGSARQALLSMIDAANGDIEKAMFRVTDWFDSAMDNVSAVYRSKMQTLSLIVALAVTLIFNADTLAIANGLWQEPTVRAAVTGIAARNVTAEVTPAVQEASISQTNAQVQSVIASVSQLGLPLGWNTLPSTLWGWVSKVLGLALTTLAVSLGAPFWYDLLKNISALRQSSK